MNDYKSIAIGGIEITPLAFMKEKLSDLSVQLNGGMSERILREIVHNQPRFFAIEQIAHTLYLQRKVGGIGGSDTADIIEAARIYDEVKQGKKHYLQVNKSISEIPFKIVGKDGKLNYMLTPKTILAPDLTLPGTMGEGKATLQRNKNGNWHRLILRFPELGGGLLETVKDDDFLKIHTLGWSGLPAALSLLNVEALLDQLKRLENIANKEKIKEFSEILKRDGNRVSYKDFDRFTGDNLINIQEVDLVLPSALSGTDETQWTIAGYKDYLNLEGHILSARTGQFLHIEGHTHPGGLDDPLEIASPHDVKAWLTVYERFTSYRYSGDKRPYNPLALILPMYEEGGMVVPGDLVVYNLQSVIEKGDEVIDKYVRNAQEIKNIKKRMRGEGYKLTPEEKDIARAFYEDLEKKKIPIEDLSNFDLENDKTWSS